MSQPQVWRNTKALSKGDDSVKELLIEVLDGLSTAGFDLDSIYKTKLGYRVIEFLKCDTVRPAASHPNRYWNKNRAKFLSLFEIAEKLEGTLYLVNYSDDREQFKVMRVTSVDWEGGLKAIEKIFTFAQFRGWFLKMNASAVLPAGHPGTTPTSATTKVA